LPEAEFCRRRIADPERKEQRKSGGLLVNTDSSRRQRGIRGEKGWEVVRSSKVSDRGKNGDLERKLVGQVKRAASTFLWDTATFVVT